VAGFSETISKAMLSHNPSCRLYASHDLVVSLGSSNVLNSHKPLKPAPAGERAKRGQKGISSEAKRLTRSELAILEESFGKQNLSFLTCTLPTASDEDFYLLVTRWAEITRKFIQALGRLLEKRNVQALIVAVTELQEKRFKKYGLVAPHLHIVFPGRNSRYESWAVGIKEITALWQRILKNELGYELDCKAATNIQKVKVSVKRYLSKYMSKGGEILDEIKAAGLGHLIPTSWLYSSQPLKNAAKAAIKKLSQTTAEFIYDNREYLKSIGLLSWFHVVTLELTDYQTGFTYNRNVAMVGGFNDKIPIADILKKLNSLMQTWNA
jgi:hypothetical protein